MMRYTVKQAGGDEETATNTNQNPPDATETMDKKSYLPGQRNPLKDAALGGGIGGLLGTALGYLYGHRGRWLAYDAIAGGAGGAGIGYMVGSSSNKDVDNNSNKKSEYSVAGGENIVRQQEHDAKKEWEEGVKEYNQINAEGGFETDPGKVGLFRAFRNKMRKGWHEHQNFSNASSYEEALQKKQENIKLMETMKSRSIIPYPGV